MTNPDSKVHSQWQFILHYMAGKDAPLASQILLIGCCGAYCGTCPALKDNVCKGCKLGYDDGTRDIRAARCAMKRCCLREKRIPTCADCPDSKDCGILRTFHAKNGYKYRKYRESLEYIRQHGYSAFIDATCTWKGAYGTLKQPRP